jgi:tRNA threonylcarbamoyladenosine biosynthesis protein TsaB
MLILAFDTATLTATAALVRGGLLLGERAVPSRGLLAAVDGLLDEAGVVPGELDGVACGVGPGSFTGVRSGLAHARGISLALDIPVAGVSTLAALVAGAAPAAIAVVDARRSEVFVLAGGSESCLRPDELVFAPGTLLVGDGAVRYRELFEGAGGVIPADADERHLPRARFHALLARSFGPADEVLPVYLRAPDAKKAVQAGAA